MQERTRGKSRPRQENEMKKKGGESLSEGGSGEKGNTHAGFFAFPTGKDD